jgi:DNA-binding Lrp family transcriptional regulator
MRTKDLLNALEGMHTIESAADALKTSKEKAIYYIHRLRKLGYVRTRKMSNNKRVYYISFENRLKGISYYDIINRYSPIKIAEPEVYKIYGKEPSAEETLIYAIKTKSLRTMLASLALFKKIKDWSELYRLAKANHVERQVGAFYDLAKRYIRVRRMTKKFRKLSLPKEEYVFRYAVEGLKSKDFKDIESVWKIYLAFNKADMEEYEQ